MIAARSGGASGGAALTKADFQGSLSSISLDGGSLMGQMAGMFGSNGQVSADRPQNSRGPRHAAEPRSKIHSVDACRTGRDRQAGLIADSQRAAPLHPYDQPSPKGYGREQRIV
jgi:hypothetical protein